MAYTMLVTRDCSIRVIFYDLLFNIYHSLHAPGCLLVSYLCSPPESDLLETTDLSPLISCVSTSSAGTAHIKCSVHRCSM